MKKLTGMQMFRKAFEKKRTKKHKAVSTDPKDIKPNPTLPAPNEMMKMAYKKRMAKKRKMMDTKDANYDKPHGVSYKKHKVMCKKHGKMHVC